MKLKFLINFFGLFLVILFGFFFYSISPAEAYNTVSGTISTNTTWNSGETYYISGSVTVNSGVTLTVEPSAIVKFSDSGYITVNGILDVNGTASSNSYFTSRYDDTVGEDTTPGDSTAPSAGNWNQIEISSGASASIDYAVVRFGGGGYSINSNVYQEGGNMSVFNSTIASSSYYGIQVASSSANISNNTIKDNTIGVYAWHNGTLTLADNTFTDNSSYPVNLNLGSKTVAASGNTATGGQAGYYLSNNTIGANQTWGSDLPYILSYDITVSSGKTLTLQPGAIIKFNSGGVNGGGLTINGTLIANGTSGNKIYFTSLLDDSVAGDTNNAGGTPGAGDWQQVTISSGASASMDNTVVRFGGGGWSINSDIYVTGGNVDINNSTIAYGMLKSGGTASITNSFIYDLSYGIYNTTATVSAEYNYWGSSTGPTHASNPGGSGSPVSNFVSFSPWLAQPTVGSGTVYHGSAPISSDKTWGSEYVHVINEEGVTVNSGETLTIEPGTIVKFASTSSCLTIDGVLDSQGTSNNFIYFTSLYDDSVGDDTDGGGASSGSAGDWGYIRVNSSASFDYSNIRYGGGSSSNKSNIYVNGGVLNVYDSVLASSSASQIELDSSSVANIGYSYFSNHTRAIYVKDTASVIVSESSFIGSSSSFGVVNIGSTQTIAEHNYWGSLSGPYHLTENPYGDGSEVSDNVDYHPWQGAPGEYVDNFYSVNTDTNEIRWNGSTVFSDEWLQAIDNWNNIEYPEIYIASDTATTSLDLTVSDINDDELDWAGSYTYNSLGVDTIELNRAKLENYPWDTEEEVVNTIMHELGHALGLGDHDYLGNIMYEVGPQSLNSFGTLDYSGYYFLWSN